MINTVHHSGLTGTNLHNPKGLQYAEDISGFDSTDWTNSGLIWDGSNWVAWKSGAGAGINHIRDDSEVSGWNSSEWANSSLFECYC